MKINIHKEKKSSLIILLMTVYLGMLLSCSTSLAVSDPNKQIIPDSNSKPVSEEKNAKYWAAFFAESVCFSALNVFAEFDLDSFLR